MKVLNRLQQHLPNFVKKQIKLRDHTINVYGNTRTMFVEIGR